MYQSPDFEFSGKNSREQKISYINCIMLGIWYGLYIVLYCVSGRGHYEFLTRHRQTYQLPLPQASNTFALKCKDISTYRSFSHFLRLNQGANHIKAIEISEVIYLNLERIPVIHGNSHKSKEISTIQFSSLHFGMDSQNKIRELLLKCRKNYWIIGITFEFKWITLHSENHWNS